jgi:hypothetical protein
MPERPPQRSPKERRPAISQEREEEVRQVTEEAKDIYFTLAEDIRKQGIEPTDLPSWKEASGTYASMRKDLERYRVAGGRAAEAIAARLEAAAEALHGPLAEQLIREIRDLPREGAAPIDPAVGHVEIPPTDKDSTPLPSRGAARRRERVAAMPSDPTALAARLDALRYALREETIDTVPDAAHEAREKLRNVLRLEQAPDDRDAATLIHQEFGGIRADAARAFDDIRSQALGHFDAAVAEAGAAMPSRESVVEDIRKGFRGAERARRNELKESALAEPKAAYERARQHYLDDYREFHSENGRVMRGVKQRLGMLGLGGEYEDLEDMKRQYNERRLAYAEAMEESVRARLGAAGKSPEYIEKALLKYRGVIRYNELVRPDREALVKARAAALGEKGPLLHEKVLGTIAGANRWLEKAAGSKKRAMAVKALITTGLVVGGGAALGAFGASSLMALAGYGGARYARSLAGMLAGSSAADIAGSLRERSGKEKQAAAKRKLEARRTGADASDRRGDFSYESLVERDGTFERLSRDADDATVAEQKAIAQALAAFFVGAGTAAAISLLDGAGGAAHHAAGVAEHAGPDAPSPSAEHPDAPAHTSAPAAEHAVPPHAGEPLTAHVTAGRGYEDMMYQLHEQLHEQYPDAAKVPPGLKEFYDLKPGPELGRFTWKWMHDNPAVSVMSERATLSLTPQGHFIFHDVPGGHEHHGTVHEHLRAQRGDADIDARERAETARLNQEEYARVHAQNGAARSWLDRLFGAGRAPQPHAADAAPGVHAASTHADALPTAPDGFTNRLGVEVRPAELHVYHRPDGSLAAYGPKAGMFEGRRLTLDEFAQEAAERLHAPVFVDKSIDLAPGVRSYQAAEYLPVDAVKNGSPDLLIVRGRAAVPDPAGFDKLAL